MVFELKPPGPETTKWTEEIIHSFTGFPRDGENPVATLALGKNEILYGTAEDGGAGQCSRGGFGLPGCGVVFQLTPASDGT